MSDIPFYGSAGMGGGGGGGATSYGELSGKPQINGQTVVAGNNTLEALKLCYTHDQVIASNTWAIQHNLNFKFVDVHVIGDTGEIIWPDIVYTNANAVTLLFVSPVVGTAIIKRV